MNLFKDIQDFHEKFGLEYNGKPKVFDDEEMTRFRIGFLREELNEYQESTKRAQEILEDADAFVDPETLFIEAQADRLDALVDLIYVALGDAYLQGFDFNEAWRRVHEANMAKVRAQSATESKRGTSYDVVKPEGWQPPDHTDLVVSHPYAEKFTK